MLRKKNNKILSIFSLFFLYYLLYTFKKSKNPINLNNNFKKFYLFKEFNKIYSSLYFLAKTGKANRPIYNINIIKNYNYNNQRKKGLCLCTVGKKENLYAKEFVNYYKLLGFNKIIIFDNNDIGDERFEDVLKDDIKNKFVEIVDIRGLLSVQIPANNFCYKIYNELYDWIAFFDFDEYLFINGSKNISNYIYNKRFQNCESILFNWHFYNDNDLEKYDNRTLLERFKRFKYKSSRVKSIVRGNIKNLIIPSTHIIGINIHYFCNSNGKRIFPKSFKDIKMYKYKAFIKHFYTKTAEEFCYKINKGDVQFHEDQPNYLSIINGKINIFFAINNITLQKIKILEDCSHLNLTRFKLKIK